MTILDSTRSQVRPVEEVARAIYDAVDPLSGDTIATVLVCSEHLFPNSQHLTGNPAHEAYRLAAMDVCRSATAAALTRLRELGLITSQGLDLIHAEEEANGEPRSSVLGVGGTK